MTEKQAFAHAAPSTEAEFKCEEPPEGKVFFLPIGQILPQNTGKKPLNQNKLLRFLASIRQYGFSKPLLVQKSDTDPSEQSYITVSDAEYLRAAELAGIEKIPCVLAENTPNQAQKTAILAQIRQKEGDMFAQAAAFRYLMERYHMTQQEIAEAVGSSQSSVANKLRLLRLSTVEQEQIRHAGLSERHARTLLRLQSPKKRLQALEVVRREQLTVKDTEALVDAFLSRTDPQEGECAPKNEPKMSLEQCSSPTYMSPRGENSPYSAFSAPTPTTYPAQELDELQGADFRGYLPRKFALQSLEPLYNSLEYALAIFRKTGKKAVMSRAEGESGVFITIHIPL